MNEFSSSTIECVICEHTKTQFIGIKQTYKTQFSGNWSVDADNWLAERKAIRVWHNLIGILIERQDSGTTKHEPRDNEEKGVQTVGEWRCTGSEERVSDWVGLVVILQGILLVSWCFKHPKDQLFAMQTHSKPEFPSHTQLLIGAAVNVIILLSISQRFPLNCVLRFGASSRTLEPRQYWWGSEKSRQTYRSLLMLLQCCWTDKRSVKGRW